MVSRDQADRLRRLVRQCSEQRDPRSSEHAAPPGLTTTGSDEPGVVLLSGGKGGVGTTTLAANLAVVLAESGLRTALLDADPRGGDVTAICRLDPSYTIGDVLARRKAPADAMVPGPHGIQILPGLWGPEAGADFTTADGDRLLGQLRGLAGRFDAVVVDAGNGPNPWLRNWWPTAAAAVMVATVETTAVLDTYAALKARVREGLLPHAWLVVNKAPTLQAARDVQFRITRSCARFLAFRPRWLGHVPAEGAVAEAARAGRLFVEVAPGCGAAGSLRRMGAELASVVAGRACRRKEYQQAAAG